MKYYYFPSTFFNQGRGRRGGALRGYGYMVGRTLKGGVADVQKVDPVALAAIYWLDGLSANIPLASC